jgi:hypothetical protein
VRWFVRAGPDVPLTCEDSPPVLIIQCSETAHLLLDIAGCEYLRVTLIRVRDARALSGDRK